MYDMVLSVLALPMSNAVNSHLKTIIEQGWINDSASTIINNKQRLINCKPYHHQHQLVSFLYPRTQSSNSLFIQCIPTLHVHMHFFRVYWYSVSEHSRQCSLSSPSSSKIGDLLYSRGVVITFSYAMMFINAQLFIDSSLLTLSNILISINTNKIMTLHISCN